LDLHLEHKFASLLKYERPPKSIRQFKDMWDTIVGARFCVVHEPRRFYDIDGLGDSTLNDFIVQSSEAIEFDDGEYGENHKNIAGMQEGSDLEIVYYHAISSDEGKGPAGFIRPWDAGNGDSLDYTMMVEFDHDVIPLRFQQ